MQRVLVATDLSSKAGIALERACQIAAQHCAALHLLHVVPRSMTAVDRAVRAEELAEIARAQSLHHPCLYAVTSSIRQAPVGSAIQREADDHAADMIVVGGHGARHWKDALFGTTADHLLGHCAQPVLIAQAAVQGPYRHVLVAADAGEPVQDSLVLAGHVSGTDVRIAVTACGSPGTGSLAPAIANARRDHARPGDDAAPELLVIAAGSPRSVVSMVNSLIPDGAGKCPLIDILVCPTPRRRMSAPHSDRSALTEADEAPVRPIPL